MITAINGFTNTDNMVLFSGAPNILSISGYGEFTKGKLVVTVLQQTSSSISITINDYTYYSGVDFEYSTNLQELVFNMCGVIPNAYQNTEITNQFTVEDVNYYDLSLDCTSTYTKPTGDIKDIRVDVYNNGEYFTSLNKKVFGDKIEFKLDVLNNFAEYNKTIPISLYIWGVGEISNLYVTKGYSYDVITKKGLMLSPNQTYIAQEFFSFYSFEETTCQFNYLDYSGNVVESLTEPINEGYNEYELDINYYQCNIVCNGKTYPLVINRKQTNTSHITRIEFQNSYGGISNIDFIGTKSNSIELTNDEYTQSLYKRKEFNKVLYNKDIKNTRTLESQYVNDISIFKELAKSYKVYEIDEEDYLNDGSKEIIITNMSIDEVQPNTYKVSITYECV